MEEPPRQDKLSLLTPEMRRITTRIMRRIAGDKDFRMRSVLGDAFETLRTKKRQSWLFRNKRSKTLDSYHIFGMAVDVVLSEKGLSKGIFRVLSYIWNSPLYEEMNEIMLEEGLRSLGATHNYDLYHGEMPIIFQGSAPHCYAYVVINAMQKVSTLWRLASKKHCYESAKRIQEIISRDKMLTSVGSALEVAMNLGWIKGFTKVDKDTWNDMDWWAHHNKEGIIISQKRRRLGKTSSERWKKHKARMEEGKGIANHTSVFGFANPQGIHTRNSHKPYPTYILKDTSEIQAVYQIMV